MKAKKKKKNANGMPLSSRGSRPNKKIGRYFRTRVEVFAGQLLKKFLNF